MSDHDEALPAVVTAPQPLPRERSPHADRFRLANATLLSIGLVAIAIAIAAVIANSGGAAPAPVAWSAWSPNAGGSTGMVEIADHVAPYYRLTQGQQLDVISPVRLTSTTQSGTITGNGLTLAINQNTSGSSAQALGTLSGSTVAYNLCGIGNSGNCTLPGTPSTARMLLLRREALEVALYTLRYLPVTNVVIVLPPSHGGTVAMLFQRASLQPLLQVPISQTLSEVMLFASQAATWSRSQEAGLVSAVTSGGLYSERVEAGQEGSTLLVLTPLTAR